MTTGGGPGAGDPNSPRNARAEEGSARINEMMATAERRLFVSAER